MSGKKGRSGRPSKYTPAVAEEICRRISAGETLISICKDDHMPEVTTVRGWVLNEPAQGAGFSVAYAKARTIQAEQWADELIDLARTPYITRRVTDRQTGSPATTGVETVSFDSVQHRQLNIDTRKWLLSKIAPKVYGDRAALQLATDDPGTLKIKIENDPDASS